MSVFPSLAELAAMWPLWITMLVLGVIVVIADYQDRKAWREFQARMRRREIRDRMKTKPQDRN